ncbi:MAG: protease complex subunit PrcB family protein [Elusimicrobiota bacterium]
MKIKKIFTLIFMFCVSGVPGYLSAAGPDCSVSLDILSAGGSLGEEYAMAGPFKKESKKPLDFETVEKGVYSGVSQEKKLVAGSEAEFRDIWNDIHLNRSEIPEIPELNFKRKKIAAVFMGQKPTGGYAVNITGIEYGSGVLSVRYEYKEPSPDSMLTQAFTSPFHIVSFESVSHEEVRFLKDN